MAKPTRAYVEGHPLELNTTVVTGKNKDNTDWDLPVSVKNATLTTVPDQTHNTPTRDGQLNPLGYQQIANLSAATALTIPTGATLAFIQAEGQNIRWRDDGTNPTATVGMLIYADSEPLYYTGTLASLRLIQATATATANISYYGPGA